MKERDFFDGSPKYGWCRYRIKDFEVLVAEFAAIRPLEPDKTLDPDAWLFWCQQKKWRSRVKLFRRCFPVVASERFRYVEIVHDEVMASAFYLYIHRWVHAPSHAERTERMRKVFDVAIVGDENVLIREAIYLKLQDSNYVR